MKRYGVALDNRIAGRVTQPEVLAKSEPAEEKTKARGDIAEVLVYNRALSDDEAQRLMRGVPE